MMNTKKKIESKVKDALVFFDNLEDIEPSDCFKNSVRKKMDITRNKKSRGWTPVVKISLSAAAMLLFAVCNIWVLSTAFKHRDTQITRSDMLDAIAEEYSMNVSAGILENY